MSCMKKPELIGPLLGYCNHRAYQRMEQKLRRYGVTPIQCRSLTYLHRAAGPRDPETAAAASGREALHRQRHRGPAGGKGDADPDPGGKGRPVPASCG